MINLEKIKSEHPAFEKMTLDELAHSEVAHASICGEIPQSRCNRPCDECIADFLGKEIIDGQGD